MRNTFKLAKCSNKRDLPHTFHRKEDIQLLNGSDNILIRVQEKVDIDGGADENRLNPTPHD